MGASSSAGWWDSPTLPVMAANSQNLESQVRILAPQHSKMKDALNKWAFFIFGHVVGVVK
ncbi:MAG: hypothetical protein A2655_03810 [Candidatus Yanofskybacteria bacterium RIFCSPHIGHO2_01_FULL_43_42]|uniref:Uncharacterized protein n=1 Tax=Candidatus Yanofskybacteria bacterium RIFCSPLOWO2_01_FULL_43_22 TaxID=1802695 RepID=A0A1F8GKW0_9BACT|nr:MAG: hypothetical protein A2655_03810 [Candidatus Yanofskybacteria bacterium RIFCSPHIGHO2_01_FULL_43_42]OGN13888.1 MAG: hypothetical protein A3D48_00090 [Candidatus Yanofskybacteria bacterium RIFCSPHIGHO2_02_FULL_43_17]OGN25049.1 MAG: hypothetical protein A3A13_03245 [Candidatus Yanofskybacteria bacterium RIFCSPLOWO2_01_FULL_43_22]